jgi:hypothetical protein
MDKSLAKYGFHRDDVTDVFMIYLFWSLVEVQWNAEKRDMSLKKTLNSGVMPLGMGHKTEP